MRFGHNRKKLRSDQIDYSKDQFYFVTTCTVKREHWFGEIDAGIMRPSRCGEIAEQQWNWLLSQYKYLISHSFIVMPNHIHALIEIQASKLELSTQKIKPLYELMGAYKMTISKHAHLEGFLDFGWQRSFHESVIVDKLGLFKVKNYIKNNPSNWLNDEFYSE